MKNIYLIPTTKEQHSIVRKHTGLLLIQTPRKEYSGTKLNIYITNDEDIKEGDYFIESLGLPDSYLVHKLSKEWKDKESFYRRCAKVILTTDLDLIKDGVQPIPDDFLEWFVKNPSCEMVEVDKNWNYPLDKSWEYKIIIPQEDSKQEPLSFPLFDKEKSELITKEGQKVVRELQSIIQEETLEEAIKREYEVRKFNSDFPFDPQSFKLGAKWMEKHMEKLKDFETWKEWKNN
jgi:hypothetical protein